jgi:hypothetical protein
MIANASGLHARCNAGRAVMGRPAGFHHNQADRAFGEPALELRTGKAMLFDDLPRASSATAIWNTLLAKSTATVVASISDSSRQTPIPIPMSTGCVLDSGYGFRVECSTTTTVRPRECLDRVLGYYDGRAYRYAYDEPEAYAAGERYFPDGMAAPTFYVPTDRRARGEDPGQVRAPQGARRGGRPGSGEA